MTVVHLEDDFFLVDVIRQVFAAWPEVHHVGARSTGNEGLAFCRAVQPSIVLLDLWLADGDALPLLEDFARLPRPPKILCLTCRADDLTLFNIGRRTIDGLVWKRRDCIADLRTAFNQLALGKCYFPPQVMSAGAKLRTDPAAFFKILSDREQQMLPAFGAGLSDADVASAFRLRAATVHSHRQAVMRKLNLHRTVDLIAWAEKTGFVPPGAMRSAGPRAGRSS